MEKLTEWFLPIMMIIGVFVLIGWGYGLSAIWILLMGSVMIYGIIFLWVLLSWFFKSLKNL